MFGSCHDSDSSHQLHPGIAPGPAARSALPTMVHDVAAMGRSHNQTLRKARCVSERTRSQSRKNAVHCRSGLLGSGDVTGWVVCTRLGFRPCRSVAHARVLTIAALECTKNAYLIRRHSLLGLR